MERVSNGPLERKIPRRGYYGIGIFHTKTEENVGTLWRTAFLYGASFIFTIGRRYKPQASDTFMTPRHIPCYNYLTMDAMLTNMPYDCRLVGIEQNENSQPLQSFQHPQRAIYLLGAEDHGLPPDIAAKCHSTVSVESLVDKCMNVAVAGSIVMYSRYCQSSDYKDE